MFGRKKQQPQGYAFKPRQYDRDEKIAIQKIVSSIPVTRKLLSQDLLVTAINNYVVKNIKIGANAARNVNTTKHPQVFFSSMRDLIESTERLVQIEPYWRFEGNGPTDQMNDLNERRDRIIKGFINETFNELIEEIEKKKNPSQKQKLFDDYQNSLINNMDICGEENFEFFKELCRKKLNIQE
ncbi:MAG: hypothetical protein E7533_07830 [Ruminococcaceae bacterium]|nr:hypothetical protein [Oscillospiraceae bacterium]